MEILHSNRVPAQRGKQEYFEGEVWIEALVQSPLISVKAVRVSFSPGARTAWHTHPGGQVLIVTSGRGRFQTWGSDIVEFSAGDTIIIPAGEKHWHGAASDGPMQHLAMQPIVNGVDSEWLEHVGDKTLGD